LKNKADDKAAEILSAYLPRATQRLIELITDEQRRSAGKPKIKQVVEPVAFAPIRVGRPEVRTTAPGH
jgi:hypothetical protein